MVSIPGVDDEYDHPSWLTAVGTGLAYAVVLGVMFALLFVVPYLIFRVL
jgi:hypothetical protein